MKQVQKIDGRLDGFRAPMHTKGKKQKPPFWRFSFIFGGLTNSKIFSKENVKEAL